MSGAYTSAGTRVYVSASLPSAYTPSGYGALTWTEIGEIDSLSEFGKSFRAVLHKALQRRNTIKRKGSFDSGDLTINFARISEPGIAILKAGRDSDDSHSFKVVLQNGDVELFTGQISSFFAIVGGASQIVRGQCDVLIDSDFVSLANGEYDPYWDNVVLLMHMDGADNGTVFTDQRGHVVTRNGNTVTKTGVKKFGTASAYFDGAGDYLSVATSSDFDLGGSEFAIESWVRSSVAFSTNKAIISKRATATYKWLSLYIDTSSRLHLEATGDGLTWGVNIYGGTLTVNTWHHIAASRDGDVWRLFVDGVQVATTTNTLTIPASTDALCIGVSTGAANDPFNGYFDDMRITKGVARYTENFTPPTSAFTDY